MKKQIIVIHGGETFKSYKDYLKYLRGYVIDLDNLDKKDWKDNLGKHLGKKFEVILPKMPCKQNARYNEWKIWFEKFIPFIREEVILIGHSLGGIFLAKYLAENKFPVKIKFVHLIAAPFDEEDSDYSLGDFILPASLRKFGEQAEKIFLYHSKDDQVVPFVDIKKYSKSLPAAEKIISETGGHFSQENFPELIRKIKE